MRPDWHAQKAAKIFEILDSGEFGLTNKEAARRLKKYGYNKIPDGRAESPFLLFLSQLHNPFVYILLAATAISYLLGHYADAIFIVIVIAINTVRLFPKVQI
jgi:magnesium-transporting ATPase (P-type)